MFIFLFYFDSINIYIFIAECGECLIYYPNVTKDFEKINLEVKSQNSIYIYIYFIRLKKLNTFVYVKRFTRFSKNCMK